MAGSATRNICCPLSGGFLPSQRHLSVFVRSVHTQTQDRVAIVVNSDVLKEVQVHRNLQFGITDGRAGNNSPERRRNLMVQAMCGDVCPNGQLLQTFHTTSLNSPKPRLLPATRALDLAAAESVHSMGFLEFLMTAFQRWRDDLHEDASYVLPRVDVKSEIGLIPFHVTKTPQPRALGLSAEFACYATDFETPIFQSTATALLQDVGVVVAAVNHISDGEHAVYALTAHPGHHAGPSYFSGFCYVNNACVACALLKKAGLRPALLDLDFHGGNGSFDVAQESGLWFRSINCAGAYPWVSMGDADVDLPAGTSWSGGYRDALDSVLNALPSEIQVLVVSLGYDTLATDPEAGKRAGSGLALETDDFRSMGSMLAKQGLPVLVVQEGGYDLNQIPCAFTNFISGLSDACKSARAGATHSRVRIPDMVNYEGEEVDAGTYSIEEKITYCYDGPYSDVDNYGHYVIKMDDQVYNLEASGFKFIKAADGSGGRIIVDISLRQCDGKLVAFGTKCEWTEKDQDNPKKGDVVRHELA